MITVAQFLNIMQHIITVAQFYEIAQHLLAVDKKNWAKHGICCLIFNLEAVFRKKGKMYKK